MHDGAGHVTTTTQRARPFELALSGFGALGILRDDPRPECDGVVTRADCRDQTRRGGQDGRGGILVPGRCGDEMRCGAAAVAPGEREKGRAELRRRITARAGQDAHGKREVGPRLARALQQRPRRVQSSIVQREPARRLARVRIVSRRAEGGPCARDITGLHPCGRERAGETHPLARCEVTIVPLHQCLSVRRSAQCGERLDMKRHHLTCIARRVGDGAHGRGGEWKEREHVCGASGAQRGSGRSERQHALGADAQRRGERIARDDETLVGEGALAELAPESRGGRVGREVTERIPRVTRPSPRHLELGQRAARARLGWPAEQNRADRVPRARRSRRERIGRRAGEMGSVGQCTSPRFSARAPLPLRGTQLCRFVLQISRAAEGDAPALHDAVGGRRAALLQEQPRILAERRGIAWRVAHPPLERRAQAIVSTQHLERAQLHAAVERLTGIAHDQ